MSKTTYVTRSFPTDFLREVIGTGKKYPHTGETYDDQSPEITAEVAALKGAYSTSERLVGDSRWANIYANVFVLPDGSAWETEYRRGTGDEGEHPYEHEGDHAQCIKVEAVEVTVTQWQRVKAEPRAIAAATPTAGVAWCG